MVVSPRAVRKLDDSSLKVRLQQAKITGKQVKITGATSKTMKHYILTLSISKASDPALKFSETAMDLAINFLWYQ
jgi:hypothetical protein